MDSASFVAALASAFALDGTPLTPSVTGGEPFALDDTSKFVLTRTLHVEVENKRVILLGHMMPCAVLAAAARATATRTQTTPDAADPVPSTIDADSVVVPEGVPPAAREQFAQLLSAWAAVPALLTLQKVPWQVDSLDAIFEAPFPSLEQTFNNSIYYQYNVSSLPAEQIRVKADLVYPAAAGHIAKATPSPFLSIDETPSMYSATHEPLIEKAVSSLGWVFNILEHKKEAERLLYEDTDLENGFMLLADTKWNPAALETAKQSGCPDVRTVSCGGASSVPASAEELAEYRAGMGQEHPAWHKEVQALALCHRRDVRSLRDLTSKHLPMLRNVLNAGTRFLWSRFGVREDSIVAFIHYVPTYYHFHVHFAHVSVQGFDRQVGRSHLLKDIIANIELVSDYYQRRTLLIRMPAVHPLAKALFEAAENFPLAEKLPAAKMNG